MSVTVASELMYLEKQMESIKELQKQRDISQGKNVRKEARDRLASERELPRNIEI
jgi:hypothetical protein